MESERSGWADAIVVVATRHPELYLIAGVVLFMAIVFLVRSRR